MSCSVWYQYQLEQRLHLVVIWGFHLAFTVNQNNDVSYINQPFQLEFHVPRTHQCLKRELKPRLLIQEVAMSTYLNRSQQVPVSF